MPKRWPIPLLIVCLAACGSDPASAPNTPGSGGATSAGSGGMVQSGGGPSGGGGTTPVGGAGGAPSAGTGGAASGGAGNVPNTGDLYIGPNGDDRNPGTLELPLRSLARAHVLVTAGQTIWVLPGTMQDSATVVLNKSGTQDQPLRVWAVEGAASRPVFDFAGQPRGSSNYRGIEIRGHYWHLRGIEVVHAADNGILISGSNNVVELVAVHDNDDSGLQILVSESMATDDTLGANNLILNSDSYENWDAATAGENADGFAAKLRIGAGNVFRGCRAWNNADDGWDLFAADDVVVIEDSWAFLNGSTSRGTGSASDGNGFKLGGEPNGPGQGGAVHVVRRNASFENRRCGFTLNNNPETPELSDCGVADNGSDDYCNLDCSPDRSVSTSGSAAKALPRNPDGSLPALP
jgi:hypothetical protein